MTQNEFEALYGMCVGKNEFEVINALYMLNNDETKQAFVARYKQMTKKDLMSGFAAVVQDGIEWRNRAVKLENALIKAAVQAENGYSESIRITVRNTLGTTKVIRCLYEDNISLRDDDIEYLIGMAEKNQ